MLWLPPLQTMMMNIQCFTPCSALVLLKTVMKLFFRGLCFQVFPPLPVPLFALNLPRRLVAVAGVFSGMVRLFVFFLLLGGILRDTAAGML
jgi:hypothetical protein